MGIKKTLLGFSLQISSHYLAGLQNTYAWTLHHTTEFLIAAMLTHTHTSQTQSYSITTDAFGTPSFSSTPRWLKLSQP